MRGRAARFLRGAWSFRAWAHRSGEHTCPAVHDVPDIRGGRGCLTCKAVV